MLQYRREVDGLRAVAVLPVILFHAGIGAFSGGFVGVDVFFVISGYLITSIILSEKAAGTFSLLKFYERRARRILPALFLVMAACVPFAWTLLLSNDFRDFSQSLFAVSAFVSNILFYRETGYFDTASELKPLLHTWSLAVEEQYYVIFPLLMLLMWRFGKRWMVGVLAAAALLSLTAAHWYAYRNPAAAFFLLPTRFWELASGALVALYFFYNQQTINIGVRTCEVLSALGLLLIGCAVFAYDESTPFPSLYAILPVLGTVLIILCASPNTLVGRVLGSKILVGIGLISYSAYLWHQPLFAFVRHRRLANPDTFEMVLLAILALVLAYLSFRFVEHPFRRRDLISRKTVFLFAAFFSVLFCSLGLMGSVGVIGVKKLELAWLGGKTIGEEFRGIIIDGANCSDRDPARACQLGKPTAQTTLIIAGDSHARVLTEPAYALMSQYDYKLIDLSASGCPFLLGLSLYIDGIESKSCNQEYQQRRLAYLQQIAPGVVILHARFPLYIDGKGFDNSVGGVELRDEYYVASQRESAVEIRYQEFRDSLDRTVAELRAAGHKVLIVGAVPSNGWDPIYRLYRIEQLGIGTTLADRLRLTDIPIGAVTLHHQKADAAIGYVIGRHPDIEYLDPRRLFCNATYCSSINGETILYSNRDHLSYDGAQLLFKYILDNRKEWEAM